MCEQIKTFCCFRIVQYPKSGEINPSIKIFVRDVADPTNKEVVPPEEVIAWGEYIFAVITWVDLETVRYMNLS
jgi:Dipeptidyl peptidase IV (DPP IV) N-terminal region